MKPKILCIYERMMPTVATMQLEFEALADYFGVDFKFVSVDSVTNNDLNNATAYYMIRPENCLSYRIAKAVKKRGAYVVTFCDDDLLNLPKELPQIPWRKHSLDKALKISNAIASSSEYICITYKRKYKHLNTYIQNTIVTDESLEKIPFPSTKQPIKIVYAAGRDHIVLFNKYIMPILQNLSEKYRDSITLTFVGAEPNLTECNKYLSTRYYKGMPLAEYREFMRNEKFHIGLAPLEDTPFHRCKYFNKYIEYSLVGTVGIYSNNIPYTYAITDEFNGLLAENTAESWLETISKCIDNADLRQKMLRNAKESLKDKHSTQNIANSLKRDIPELLLSRDIVTMRNPIFLYKLEHKAERIIDLLYMSMYYLKKEGLKTVLNRVKERL